MPLDNSKLKKIYETLKSGGYNKDYSTFVNDFAGNENYPYRKKVYDLLRANGASGENIGNTYEDFMKMIYKPAAAKKPAQNNAKTPSVTPSRTNTSTSGKSGSGISKGQKNQFIQQSQEIVNQTKAGNKLFSQRVSAAPKPFSTDASLGINNKNVGVGRIAFNPQTKRFEEAYTTSAGNQYFNRSQAVAEQNRIDDARERKLHPIETQLRDAYAERDRLEKLAKERVEQLEKEYNDTPWYLRAIRGLAESSRSPLESNPTSRWENDMQYNQYMSALRNVNQLITTLEDKRNNKTNEFWHSFATEATNGYTFSFGGKSRAMDVASLSWANQHIDKINEKRKTGEPLTEEEQAAEAVLKNAEWNNSVQGMYGDQYGAWARAGKGAAITADFMIDFLMAGGGPASTAKGIYIGVVKGGTKLLGKFATKSLGKFALKSTGVTLGALAGGAQIANTVRLPKTMADAASLYTGDVFTDDKGNYVFGHFEEDENGKPKFVKGGESAIGAILKAERSAITESASELVGEFLPGSKVILKEMSNVGLRKISGFLTSIGNKNWYKNYTRALKTTGFHGIAGEAFEEYIGMGMDAMLGGDEWKNLANLDTHIDIWLGCATMGGILGAPKVIGTGYSMAKYYKYKNDVGKSDKTCESLFNEKWGEMRNAIDNAENDKISSVVSNLLKSQENLNSEQAKALIGYAINLQRMRGYNISMSNNEDNEEKDENAQALDESYAIGYNTSEAKGMRDLSISLSEQRKRVEGIVGEGSDFMAVLDGAPDKALQHIKDSDLNEDEKKIVTDYVLQRNSYNAMNERINNDAEGQYISSVYTYSNKTNKQDGKLHQATLKEKSKDGTNKQVFIIDGEVVMNEDGTTVDTEKSDKTIVIYDTETGEKKQIDPASSLGIQSLGAVIGMDEIMQQAESQKQQYIQQQMDIASGTIRLKVGEQVTLPSGENAMVVSIDQTGETAIVRNEKGEQMEVSLADLQAYADQQAIDEYKQRNGLQQEATSEEPAAEPTQQEAEDAPEPANEQTTNTQGAPAEYKGGMTLTIRDEDGAEKEAKVVGRVRTVNNNGKLEYELDENGGIVQYIMDGEVHRDRIQDLNEKVVGYTSNEEEQQDAKTFQDSNVPSQYRQGDRFMVSDGRKTFDAEIIAEENEDGLLTVQFEGNGGTFVQRVSPTDFEALIDTYISQAAEASEPTTPQSVQQKYKKGDTFKIYDGEEAYEATVVEGPNEDGLIPVRVKGKEGDYIQMFAPQTLDELTAPKEKTTEEQPTAETPAAQNEQTAASQAPKVADNGATPAAPTQTEAGSNLPTTEQSAETTKAENENVIGELSPIPVEKNKKGKVVRMLYHKVPMQRTLEDLYDGTMDQAEIDQYVDKYIEDSKRRLDYLQNKKIDVGINKQAYLEAKKKHEADLAEVQAELAYYENLKQEVQRITQRDARNEPATEPTSTEPLTLEEVAANFAATHKVTPESLKAETGMAGRELKGYVGLVAKAENGGVSIERMAEMLTESQDWDKLGGTTDMMQDARNMLIEAFRTGNPRSYAKKQRQRYAEREQESELQEIERYAWQAYRMTAEEFLAYEEQALPAIIQKYAGFDFEKYYASLCEQAEQTERESETNNTSQQSTNNPTNNGQPTESTEDGGSSQVLPRKESNDKPRETDGGQPAAGRPEGTGNDGLQSPVSQGTLGEGAHGGEQTKGNIRIDDGRGGNGSPAGRQQSDLSKTEITAPISDETNEFGKPFVLSSDGTTTFGSIQEDSGLKSAPIKLSLGENAVDKNGQNHGYGLLHIEAGHGKQILDAGFSSVEEFVETVAKNWNTIREGGVIAGNQTYLLEISDEHNNTLFIQLSRDGNYWNINSAGIFKKKYSRRKPEVFTRPALKTGTNTDSSGVNSGQSNGVTAPAGNSPQTSASKGKENKPQSETKQTETAESLPNNISEQIHASEVETELKAAVERRKAASIQQDGAVTESGGDGEATVEDRRAEGAISATPRLIDPREMSEEERKERGDKLRTAEAVHVAPKQIVATKEKSARKVAEEWWGNNVGEAKWYDTEAGEVEINRNSVESSLAHGYGQMKLDAITSLVDGFANAVYLGTMPDAERRETQNHYFAYPIKYNGKRCYVFCRALHDNNTNRLYVHEVFVEEGIKKGNTLQTAASKPHGGISLYRDILANVLEVSDGKGKQNKPQSETKQTETAESLPNNISEQVNAAEAETNTNPTEAQKQAGNYKKGHISIDGFQVSIENPKGSVRRGTDASGKQWEQTMHNTYGYLRGTEGVDGDHIDVFLSDNPEQGDVFVVDQVNKDGTFDEHKVMYGFPSEESARQAYLANYEEGWQGLGAITRVSREEFKKWVQSSHRKTKPFAEYKGVKTKQTNTELPTHKAFTRYNNNEAGTIAMVSGDSKRGYLVRYWTADANIDEEFAIGEQMLTPEEFADRLKSGKLTLATSETAQQQTPATEIQETADKTADAEQKTTETQERQTQKSREENGKTALYQKAGASEPVSKEEAALRDALVEFPREAGIEIVMDAEDGQRMLDAVNGEVRMMGSRVDGRMEDVGLRLEGRELGVNEKAVVDVYSGKAKSGSVSVERDDKEHRIVMRQGTENRAGTKHSLLRHYGTAVGTITAEDLLLIPEVIGLGEMEQNGKKRVYRLSKDGVRYTVLSEVNNGREEFCDFYSNRKGGDTSSSNTQTSARGYDVTTNSDAKVHEKSDTSKSNDAKLQKSVPSENDVRKKQQLQIINETNPAPDDYHTWVRSTDDILTFDEAVRAIEEEGELLSSYPDVSDDMIRKALQTGRITIYSSNPIKNGAFVTPSLMQAQDYAGRGKVYSAEVNTSDVAWINTDEGMFASTSNAQPTSGGSTIRFFRTKDGHAYGFVKDGKIYIDPRTARADTPIHEYTHLWAEAFRRVNPEGWKDIVRLIKGTDLWEQVRRQYPELTAEDELAEEVLAHYSGRRGAERLRAEQERILKGDADIVEKAAAVSAIQRVKEALSKFWRGVADWLGLRFTTAEEVADRVLADMLHGVNPANEARADGKGMRMNRNEEEAQIVARAKADGTYMKAPNGKPSRLNPQQWVQVRTQAFKEWFGDWENGEDCSKVVDENGEPLVVYRGASFDPLSEEAGNGVIKQESYFTPDSKYAQRYGKVRGYFLNVRNPFDVRNNKDAMIMQSLLPDWKKFSTGVTGALDWAELSSIDIDEFREEYSEYDAMILDEGGDPNGDGGVTYRGISFLALNGGTQIKSATDNVGTFDAYNPDIRYQLIGERGASALDSEQESTIRLDNLRIAREMEAAGKDAKTVKLATGWERGADGKWRYEIEDGIFDITGELHPERRRLSDSEKKELDDAFGETMKAFEKGSIAYKEEITEHTDMADIYEAGGMERKKAERIAYLEDKENKLMKMPKRLDDYLDNEALFSAYPELREMDIDTTEPEKAMFGLLGSYNPSENAIKLNDMSHDTLIHEVQHAIQHIEGFEIGGNKNGISDLYKTAKKEWQARKFAENLSEKRKELGDEVSQQKVYDALVEEYKEAGLALPSESVRAKGFNYFVRGYADASLDHIIKAFDLDNNHGANFDANKAYKNLSGEVEARNVQKRLGMTTDERRASLAAETEDVAREDQIFLNDGIGVSMSESADETDLDNVNRRFNERLLELFSNPKQKDRVLHLGMASKFLQESGISNAKIILEYDKLVKKSKEDYKNNHPFLISDIKDLPLAIHHPIAVFDNTNGKDAGRVILTELKKDGRNFIVVVQAREQKHKGGVLLEINEISTLYPKEAKGILKWIIDKNYTNIDKKKALRFIEELQPHAGTTIKREELDSAANVVKDFKNPSISGENMEDTAAYRQKSGEESTKANSQTTAHEKRNTAQQLADRLNTPVRIAESTDEITHPNPAVQARRRRAKGWYDRRTGEVVIVLPNCESTEDVAATVAHETIAHKGLRELVGEEHYDEFLDTVHSHLRGDLKQQVEAEATRTFIDDITKNGKRARNYEQHRRTATDELLGRMAEKPLEEFTEGERTLWGKIKAAARKIIDRFLGTLKLPSWFVLGDNELRYILWRSKERLERGREHPIDLARDIVKREELGLSDDVYAMSDGSETFKERQRRAVATKGTVMPGLNDAEVKVVDVPRHDFTGTGKQALASAKKWAKENITGVHSYVHDGMKPFDYVISNKSIDKYLSATSVNNSENMGVHLSVLKKLPDVISESIETEEHAGYTKGNDGKRSLVNPVNDKELIHRFYGSVSIDGKVYRVKTTIKEYSDASHGAKAYNYEVTKIELIDAPFTGVDDSSNQMAMTTTNSISVAKLLKDVEKSYDKGKKLLDESNSPEEETALYKDGDFQPRDRAIARDSYNRMVGSGMYQFQEAMQDSMLGLKRLYQSILGKDTRIEDVKGFENAYLAENRMSSVNAAEQHEYYVTFMKPLIAAVGELAGTNESMRQELTDYMMAKHGLERNEVMANRDFQKYKSENPNGKKTLEYFRNRDYAGLTALTGKDNVADAEDAARLMVQDYEREHDTTELWNCVNAATSATLEKIFRSGLLSLENYEQIKQMYKNYIPLRGWDETTSDEVYGYLTSKNGPLGASPIKRAEGRSSKADDPIATIALMADDAIRQGNRNLMKQTFLNFVLNNPSDLVSVGDLWLKYNDVTDEWEPVFVDIEDGDTSEDISRKVEAFEARMEQLAKTDKAHYKRGRDAQSIPYKVIKNNINEHQVLVRRNGRTYVLTVNGNPRAAQALNGLTNPDVDTKGVIGNLLRSAERVNRFISAAYTTRNPDFVVSNFVRDLVYSNCMVWVKEGGEYAVRFHKNVGRVNPWSINKLFRKWNNGNLDESIYLERMFKAFMLGGGETGYTNIKDIEGHKREIAKELKRNGNKVRNAWAIFTKQLDLIGGSVENCARFAAFLTSREMGRSVERSIYDAKEISVNFNKKGSGGKMLGASGQTTLGDIGSYTSGAGRLLYIFWNAAIQGSTNFGRQVKRNPKKALTAMATMYILGSLAPILAKMIGGDDEDDKNAYYNLPENVRRSNLCLYAGDTWIKIALPVEFRAFYGLGELSSSVLTRGERYSNEELTYQIAGQVSQLFPIDMLEGGGGFKVFVPSLAKPIYEAEKNQSWTGLPIYKDTEWNKNDPEWTKVYQNANSHLVNLSKWANELTGGDDYKKGYIDINPAKIEHELSGYFGGAFSTIDKLVKMGETVFGEREFEWRNMLLANRVLATGDERTENRKLTNEYFKYNDMYEETRRLLKHYEEASETDDKYKAKLALLKQSEEYTIFEVFDSYKPLFKALYDAKKDADETTLNRLEQEEHDLRREMVDLIHEIEDDKNPNIDGRVSSMLQREFEKNGETRKSAGARIAKNMGGKDTYGSPQTEYGKIYESKRDYIDLAEDVLLQSESKKAKDGGDKARYKRIESARRTLTNMRKVLERTPYEDSDGNIVTEEDVMNRIRTARRKIIQNLGLDK